MPSHQWFVIRNGQRLGPYRFHVLQLLAERNKLQPDDLICTEGMTDWKRANALRGLFPSPVHVEPILGQSSGQPRWPPANINSARAIIRSAAAAVANRSKYFLQHWRGELSLPVSYWINLVLIGGVWIGAIAAAVSTDFFQSLGALGRGCWVLAILVCTIALTLWQFVGVWRSTERHVSRGGSPGWARAAKVIVVLGLLRLAASTLQQLPLLQQSLRLVFSGDSMPTSQLRILNHATEVELAGGMSLGTANALKTILDATPTIRIVQLNNVGGWISEGDRVRLLIKAHGLSTFTARECDSACLLAFMGGKERYLGTRGRLGFHEASVEGVGGGVAREGTERFRRVFLENRIPASFVNRALSTPPSAIWYPTTRELLDGHVITAAVNENDYAITDVSAWRDPDKLEADFAGVPVFAALKRAEPAIYQNLKESYISGIQGGVSRAEMAASVRSAISGQILPKYLQIAPDAPLVAYWRSQLTDMRELRAIDAKYCVAFLLPSPDTSKVAGLLSKEASAAELASLTVLLDTTALKPAAVPPRDAVQGALNEAALRTERLVPGALRLIANPQQSARTPEKFCDAEVALYDTILALPASQAGPILRFLAAGS